MMIDGVTNSGAMPVLERLIQFSGRRHRLIAHNIANLSTPNFRPADVSVKGFQQQLREAVDLRRSAHGSNRRELIVEDSSEITFYREGISLHPNPAGQNILFHDGNDRNLERIMQDLVENFMTFRTAVELMRSRNQLINSAIRERV